MRSSANGCCGITRRGFLLGAGTGLVAGGGLTWLGMKGLKTLEAGERSSFSGRTKEVDNPRFGIPGRYPGRVAEVRHAGVVRDDNTLDRAAVSVMMGRGMCDLTGADHPTEAWRRFFESDDVVGIKVNPVGRKRKPADVGSISSPEVVLEIVRGLKSANVKASNIIIFERYAEEFRDAYLGLMGSRDMDGVRWFASSATYDEQQVDIEGYPSEIGRRRPERDPHVVGYDPDVYVSMGFAADGFDPKDDRRFRSHLSMIVTRMVNKIITIPCLKDHRSAGVTLALKNLSHGFNNNVARSHLADYHSRNGAVNGPNQCNTFIPTAVAQGPTREKWYSTSWTV
jgi:hypothetical protein